MTTSETSWRRCSTCKKPIKFGAQYWVCSVSTCNRARASLVFCNLSCWDAHVPVMNHREAWAEEKTAPRSAQENTAEQNSSRARASASGKQQAAKSEQEILVVASKVKDYIKTQSGMNTSGSVLEVLSDVIRTLANEAVSRAKADGRQTVMERDVSPLSSRGRASLGDGGAPSSSSAIIRRRPGNS